MVKFRDLPMDILPFILAFVVKSSHLVSTASVNSAWNAFATPQLYERVSIYSWHKDSKGKVLRLFSTLATCPHLAKHVRRLEIRDFPKAILNSKNNLLEVVAKGLKNCSNLRSCTWTRDGSLSSEILSALSSTPTLCELEFNGHSQGQYDPWILCQFKALSRLSIIMPSSAATVSMFMASGATLRHLTIICKASPIINDAILEEIASFLPNLEEFFVTGCPKVTERSITAIVSSTQVGLRALGLEGVSTRFDMDAFSRHCINTQGLKKLRSITLTLTQVSAATTAVWAKSVLHLLSRSPLERFQIYATSSTMPEPPPLFGARATTFEDTIATFWTELITAHGSRLRRFSVLRIPLKMNSIEEICKGCERLEEMFVVAGHHRLDSLADSFSGARNLKTLHVNFPSKIRTMADNAGDAGSGDDSDGQNPHPIPSMEDALAFVKRCPPTLRQFGCNTRVWQVGRKTWLEADRSVASEVVLLPPGSPDIPEQFLVVRT